MKLLIDKLKAILSNKKGESLLESVVSILIFTLLIAGVNMLIRNSALITGKSLTDTKNKQETVNELVAGKVSQEDGIFTLTGRALDKNGALLTNIAVNMDVKKAEKTSGSMTFKSFGPDYSEFFTVIMHFPGFENVQVNYSQSGAYIALGKYNDYAEFSLPPGSYTVQVVHPSGGMWYTVPYRVIGSDQDVIEITVPIKTITVTGKADNSFYLGVAMVGGNWVYNATSATRTEFDVFENGGASGIYNVHIHKDGFTQLILPVAAEETTIDISNYFYEIIVPAEYTNVSIQQYGWIVQNAGSGDKIILLRNGQADAKLHYKYERVDYVFTFSLDGSNPFSSSNLPHLTS